MTIPSPRSRAPLLHEPWDRRLHLDERLPGALQRVACGQFDRMTQQLTDPAVDDDEAIHTARKTMKRLRGMLRLVRDEVGPAAYHNENVLLRDTSRLLAPARDGYIMVETLDRLRRAYAGILRSEAFSVTRGYLLERHEASRRAVIENEELMTHVLVTLMTARSRYAAWEADRVGRPPTRLAARGVRNEFGAVAPGLARVYRRGRRGMKRAYQDHTTESFHEWRKRVKYLRYQLEALEPIWPDLLSAHARRLDELGEILGNEHDLAELSLIVLNDEDATADQRQRTLLLALIHRTRLELQYEARSLGRSLFSESPDEFVGRLGSYWSAAHELTPAGR